MGSRKSTLLKYYITRLSILAIKSAAEAVLWCCSVVSGYKQYTFVYIVPELGVYTNRFQEPVSRLTQSLRVLAQLGNAPLHLVPRRFLATAFLEKGSWGGGSGYSPTLFGFLC